MADLLHHRGRALHTGFASRYTEIDPDRDTRTVVSATAPAKGLADALENRVEASNRVVRLKARVDNKEVISIVEVWDQEVLIVTKMKTVKRR